MRRMLLAALAVATFVSSGILLHRAALKAHTPAPVADDAKATDAGLLHLAANVCGAGGCVAVQVKRLDKHQLHKAPTPPPGSTHGLPGSIS
jgi:hypothetical protein